MSVHQEVASVEPEVSQVNQTPEESQSGPDQPKPSKKRGKKSSGKSKGKKTPGVTAEPEVKEFPEVRENLERFNKKYFIISDYGGKCVVGYMKSDVLRTQSFYDFQNAYRNQTIVVDAKNNGDPEYDTRANSWLNHRDRRQYDEVVFLPNYPDLPHDILNLWTGFAYEPKKGDCSLYLDHVRQNVCNGEDIKYNYTIRWMANCIQHPDEPGQVALVVQGEKGVGKNVFAEGFGNLFGRHSIVVTDQQRITGHFNSHLRDKVVCIADEAFFAGDHTTERRLKGLITGRTLQIESKGVNTVEADNLLHFILISNDAFIVRATRDERRFLVMKCGKAHQQETKYFAAIDDQMKNGGYSALLYHLMHEVDLTDFDVRTAPHTRELRDQMSYSMDGVRGLWLEILQTGETPGAVQADGKVLLSTTELVQYWEKTRRRKFQSISPKEIAELFRDFEFPYGKKQRIRKDGDWVRPWRIGTLAECRALWDKCFYKETWLTSDGNLLPDDWIEISVE